MKGPMIAARHPVMPATAPTTALTELWRAAGHSEAALDAVTLTGSDPVLPSSFAVGTAAQAAISASALAAAELWHLRGGGQQSITVDMRDAAIEFRSERYLRIDGNPVADHRAKRPGRIRKGPPSHHL